MSRMNKHCSGVHTCLGPRKANAAFQNEVNSAPHFASYLTLVKPRWPIRETFVTAMYSSQSGDVLVISRLSVHWRSRFPVGNRSVRGDLPVANLSPVVGNRSALGRLSNSKRRSPMGSRPPRYGGRKYHLLSHQPESRWCRLKVILFLLILIPKNQKINVCGSRQVLLSSLCSSTGQPLQLYRCPKTPPRLSQDDSKTFSIASNPKLDRSEDDIPP